MRVSFVVVSVADRIEQLNTLVDSIIAQPKFDKIELNLMFQGPQSVAELIRNRGRYTNVFVVPDKLGCHGARVELLRLIQYDVYINLDDDIELTQHTDYAAPIQHCLNPGTGFVLTNWARTPELLLKKVPAMKPAFVPQILVYQGGGMVYADKIGALMRALPATKQTFDTAWPLTAYLNGYTNYRFLGSLAVHRVCTTGGMSAYLDETPVQTMLERYVRYRRAKRQRGNGHDILIPLDADVLPAARAMHKTNLKR